MAIRSGTSFAALAALAIAAGCSGNSGNSVAPIVAGSATPGPSPTPRATPTPIVAPVGDIESFCTIANDQLLGGSFPSVPGNYVLFLTEGQLNGTTLTNATNTSEWVGVHVAANPSASPTAVATATPVPSPTPATTSSPSEVIDLYFGSYDVPAFSAAASTPEPGSSATPGPSPTPVAIQETKGCFVLEHIVSPTPSPGATDADTAAIGIPFDFTAYEDGQTVITEVTQEGLVTNFTLSSLTSSGGSGTFSLDAPVTGSWVVGPAQPFYETDDFKARVKALQKHGLVVRRF